MASVNISKSKYPSASESKCKYPSACISKCKVSRMTFRKNPARCFREKPSYFQLTYCQPVELRGSAGDVRSRGLIFPQLANNSKITTSVPFSWTFFSRSLHFSRNLYICSLFSENLYFWALLSPTLTVREATMRCSPNVTMHAQNFNQKLCASFHAKLSYICFRP